jgi:NADPH:quinone reductase-like Zn-dependent oxidoreductase
LPSGRASRGSQIGDEVFGDVGKAHVGDGSFAQYVTASAANASHRPTTIPATTAAALPRSATTALEAVDALHASAGDPVAIVGAAGGIGSFATEFAARRGLRVIAVTRPENFDYVQGLGASDVIDYTSGDVVAALRARVPDGLAGIVDLFHDAQGVVPFADALRPDGWLVSPLARGADALLEGRPAHVHVTGMPYQRAPEVLAILAAAPTHVVVETLPLDHAADALARQASRQVRGKLVLTIE